MRECFLSWTQVSLAAGHKLHIVLTTVPRAVEVGWFGLEQGPIGMLHLFDVPNSPDIASAQTVWHESQLVSDPAVVVKSHQAGNMTDHGMCWRRGLTQFCQLTGICPLLVFQTTPLLLSRPM